MAAKEREAEEGRRWSMSSFDLRRSASAADLMMTRGHQSHDFLGEIGICMILYYIIYYYIALYYII